MQVYGYSKHQFAGKGFIGTFSTFFTKCKIVFHRLLKRMREFIHTCTLKSDDIFKIYYFPVEITGFFVKDDMTSISFIF